MFSGPIIFCTESYSIYEFVSFVAKEHSLTDGQCSVALMYTIMHKHSKSVYNLFEPLLWVATLLFSLEFLKCLFYKN